MNSKKKECVYEYVSKNPDVGIMECCKDLGLPYKTVKKWEEWVEYRGLQKNTNRLYALLLSSNLYMLARAGRSLEKPEIA